MCSSIFQPLILLISLVLAVVLKLLLDGLPESILWLRAVNGFLDPKGRPRLVLAVLKNLLVEG